MKILSIGNSFSMDAQAWGPDIARAGGEDMLFGNLYIGGCSLERHMQNVESGLAAYEYYVNTKSIGNASVQTGIHDEKWDFVTLQQASHFSGMPETYEPFALELAEFVKANAKGARIVIHETWAYEHDSQHQGFAEYSCNTDLMHEKLHKAYYDCAARLNAGVIPVGEAVRLAREYANFDTRRGGKAITRDGFHLSLTLGRFLAGAVWFEYFTGRDAKEITFVPVRMEYAGKSMETGERLYRPMEAAPDERDLEILKFCAHRAVSEFAVK